MARADRLQVNRDELGEDVQVVRLVRSRFEMHHRAFNVFALVLLITSNAECDDKTSWYSGLRTVFKDCPQELWRNAGQDEFLEKFRHCVQDRALSVLDSLLADDIIPIFNGLELVRYQEDRLNSTRNYTRTEPLDEMSWTAIILKRLLRVLRTHVFKVDVDQFSSSIISSVNNSKTEVESNVFEGRRRNKRRNKMMPLMMMGFLLIGSILIPMGFQFLAVLGGKALLLAKMALILSSIQGLKKIATNGVNYGLYHAPVGGDGWHDRRHVEPNPFVDLPFPQHPIRP